MKILINSNSPATKTGYGVQVAQLAERLHDAGHDVAISATWGQNGFIGQWKPENPRNPHLWDKGIRVYPAGWGLNGIDIVHNNALHWFGGDPLNGWIIVLGDVWSLAENPLLADFNVAAWAPVDHFPVPPGVLRFFENSRATCVAMSRFGEQAFRRAGADPVYVPLAVDTSVYKPTPTIVHDDHGEIPARALLGVSERAFLVGMVAMNKDPGDRKGFNEAFAAFAAFYRQHNDAVLYVHSDKNGMGQSFNLEEMARAHMIPPNAIAFPDTYGYQIGWSPQMMAAAYSAFDVLLSPSRGEGFCVPLIEAQACGTPVICTDFSAQAELVGAGWKVQGQQAWDMAQSSFYMTASIDQIVMALEDAYTSELDEMAPKCIAKAAEYDADRVFEEHWLPLLAQMEADPELPALDRPPIPTTDGVAVIVPAMRPENLPRLVESFQRTTDGSARLYVVVDEGFDVDFIVDSGVDYCVVRRDRSPTTYAEKVNAGLSGTTEPWVLLVGDDVEFQLGWIEAARALSDRFDVIGTNDSAPGRIRNPEVAAGEHADHFFVRRSYVDTYGACLDGPGHLAPTCYRHWFVDREMIQLAKARGVFAPCLASIVEHHHPGYDGREDLRFADPTYSSAVQHSTKDEETWDARRPLVEMQRTTRGRRSAA